MIDFHSQLPIIPDVYETAELQDSLEHSGGITITWKSATDVEIPLGAYITYGGMRYQLMQPYAPSKESNIHYKYSPTFKHPQAMLDFKPFWIKSKDADNNDIYLRTTSYTGFPYVIAQKLCDFFAEYVAVMHDTYFAETVGTDWTYHISAAVDEHGREINQYTIITVAFDGCSIKSAADSIAEAMGCNVFFDWSTKTIRFVAGTTIQGETYNCFHVLGGTTNMGKNTASGSFAAITQRLTLRTEADDEHTHEGVDYFPGSIIKTGAALEQGGLMLIKDLILDDIYPKMELYVCYTHQRLCNLTDNDTGEFIVDHWEKDGQVVPADTPGAEPVLKHFAKWYVRLSLDPEGLVPYKFDQSKLINDKPLSMLFQMDYRNPEHMSKLVGREFELTYFPSAVKEWDKTDTVNSDNAYVTYTGTTPETISEFRIAIVAEGETILPTTSTIVDGQQFGLIPQIGDKVTLVNMALTEEKGRAQDELLAAAQEIIALMQTPSGEYSETVIFGDEDSETHQVPAPRMARLMVGDESPFGEAHGPIVTSIQHNLDTDVAEVTVGSWTRKTRTGGTADKLETVTVSANSSTEGGTPYSSGSIGEGGGYSGYGGNSVDTYTQTNPKPESMFFAGLSNTIDAVACDTDGKVKMTTDVLTMVTAYAGVKDVTAACTVAVKQLPPVQPTETAGVNLKVGIFVTDRNGDETEITATNLGYEMTDEKRWLRLNFPLGYDLGALHDSLTQMFGIEHPAFLEREVGIVVQGQRQGTDGKDGAFKSRSFTRTNVDLSNVQPTGGTYSNPLPGDATTHKETYIIDDESVEITWYDGIPQGEEMLWSTVRTFHSDNMATTWSTPSQETDTDTLDIEFSPSTAQPAAPIGNTPFADHSSEGWYDPNHLPTGQTMIWRAERKVSNGEYDGDWVISRIKGENAIRVDLDNQHENFLYDDAGNRKSNIVTSQARLYDGTAQVTSGVAWSIDPTGTHGVVLNDSTSPYYASINTSGLLTVNGINLVSAVVKVKAMYNGLAYYSEFTSNRNSQDKYDLVIEPNAITYNSSESWTNQNITVKATRLSIDGAKTENIAMNEEQNGIIFLAAKYKESASGTASWHQVTGGTATARTLTVNSAIVTNNGNILIELRKIKGQTYNKDNPSTYTVEDYETIPINKVSNGTDGADLGENLIDKSKGAHVFNVNDRTGNPRYFDPTVMRYTPARIPSGTYSGQMVVTTKNCNYGTGAKVRLLIKTTAASGAITQTFVDSGVITADGTYEVKYPNITLNPQSQTWSGIVILALDNFGNGGTVTVERVKLETGSQCSGWSLSENDKIGPEGPAGQDGQNGQDGADGNGIVSETSTFNISRNGTSANENTPPSNLYYQNWQTQQVEPTLDYPFIWQKKVTEYTQSATTTKYYCNGRRGNNGQDGQSIKGDTGPMYFMQGEWSSSTTYTRTSELIPLVFYSNGNDWNTALDCYGHYYYLNADSASGSDVPGTSSKWVQCDEFAVVITRGLFAQFAKLGAFVISGHWMFSQEGTINGSASTDYRQFDPNHPNDNTTTNFIPTYAVDGYTGKVYMNDAYLKGEIEADSGHIGGFKIGQNTITDDNSTPTFTLDSTNNKMIVGNIEVRSQQNFLQNGEPNYDWSGLATKSGYDNVTAIGARHFINSGENGGHLRLNSSNGGVFDVLTGGNTTQSKLRMGQGMNNIRATIDGINSTITLTDSSNRSIVITPEGITCSSGKIKAKYFVGSVHLESNTYYANVYDDKISMGGNSDARVYLPAITSADNGLTIFVRKTGNGWCRVYKNNTTDPDYLRQFDKDNHWQMFVAANGEWY